MQLVVFLYSIAHHYSLISILIFSFDAALDSFAPETHQIKKTCSCRMATCLEADVFVPRLTGAETVFQIDIFAVEVTVASAIILKSIVLVVPLQLHLSVR